MQAFPDEFRYQFKVFDFGFYCHSEHFEGEFPEEFDMAIAEAQSLSPYYLLFGKQSDASGICSKIWVAIKLPDEREFSCMDEAELEGLKYELTMLGNVNMINFTEYYRNECNAMHRLKEFIIQTTNCCEIGSMINNRDIISGIEYKIKMFEGIEDINLRSTDKDIAWINGFSDLRFLSFKINARLANDPLEFSTLCTPPIFINFEFEYLNHRSDSETKVVYDLKANRLYKFQDLLGNENVTYYGTQDFPFLRGGRITMRVYFEHDQLVKLCEYKFSIKGYNPSLGAVFYACDSEYPDFWFPKKLVQQESSHGSTSITDPAQHFWVSGGTNLWQNWDDHKSCPHYNFSNNKYGWGLCQITNPPPQPIMLWNWRANLWAATQLLYQKIKEISYGDLGNEIDAVNDWNDDINNKSDQVAILSDNLYATETWTFSGSSLFTTPKFVDYFGANASSGKRSYLDAVLLKYNNGLGQEGKHFIYLTYDNNNKPVWTVMNGCTRNGSMAYYVKEICETVLAR